jgi:hypothetical protein
VVACCVKDIEDKNPHTAPRDHGQHIHAVCRACYGRYRKPKVAQSESVLCPQCRSSALVCVPLDTLVYNVDSTLSGRMGANRYIVHAFPSCRRHEN